MQTESDVRERMRVRKVLDVAMRVLADHPRTNFVLAFVTRSRRAIDARARFQFCHALRTLGFSYPEIGWVLDLDHTSVMYAVTVWSEIVVRGSPRTHKERHAEGLP